MGSQLEFVDARHLVHVASSCGVACTFGGVRRCFPRGVVLGLQSSLETLSDRSEGVDGQHGLHTSAQTSLHLVPADDFVIDVSAARAWTARPFTRRSHAAHTPLTRHTHAALNLLLAGRMPVLGCWHGLPCALLA